MRRCRILCHRRLIDHLFGVVTMKSFVVHSLLTLLTVVAARSNGDPISYAGYQVLRVKTLTELADVQAKLSTISFEQWNHDIDSHIDIVVAPDQIEKLESLGLEYRTLHEDLGESITAEAHVKTNYRRDVNDLSWYDSYHPYADHVQYFSDLHEAFPANSELISSGRSYENRSIHGIHLFGDDGPGKPAVLYHGTVHAREWITAPVRLPTS